MIEAREGYEPQVEPPLDRLPGLLATFKELAEDLYGFPGWLMTELTELAKP